MRQNVKINGVTYSNVPSVEIPYAQGSGNAVFVDTSDATLSSGDYMVASYTAYAGGTKYTGSITTNTSTDVTVSGRTVSVPAGYYSSAVSKSVSSGSATAPATISGTSASVSTGTNTITLSKTISVTPTVSAGYVSSGTAGNSSVSLTASVTTKGATTYTPTTSDQTIASGTYLTGAQTIKGDQYLVRSNIKSGVTIFGVRGSLTAATVSQDGTTKVLTIS